MKFDPMFLDTLQAILAAFDSASLTSGPRSIRHNQAIGGAKLSPHIEGKAADLIFDSMQDLRNAAKVAIGLQCTGVEVDLVNLHLHLDMKERKRPWHIVTYQDGSEHLLVDWLSVPLQV